MHIISLVNSKGGVGKTTLSINIATYLNMRGYRVCLVDADPQSSIRDWRNESELESFDVMGLYKPQTLKSLPTIGSDLYDFAIVDTPGKFEDTTKVAVEISSAVLVPVHPSSWEVWAIPETLRMIKIQRAKHKNLISRIVINRVIRNCTLTKQIDEALDGYDIDISSTYVMQRAEYEKMACKGKTIFHGKNKAAKEGQREIEELSNEILLLIAADKINKLKGKRNA